MYLGIDPAKEGAAVLMSNEGEVTDVWSWKYRKRKKPIYQTLHTCSTSHQVLHRELELRDGGTIAKHISAEIDLLFEVRVGIEDAYVNVNHKKTDSLYKSKINASVQSGLRVARFGGEMIGGLSSCLGYKIESIDYVMAVKWRKQVLRLNPYTKRDTCKEVSLSTIPVLCPSIQKHLQMHGQLDHITDAVGVALWLRSQHEY